MGPPDSAEQKTARIIRATEADLPQIIALAGVVWRAHYPGIISRDQIEYMLERMYDLDAMRGEMQKGIAYDCLWEIDELAAFASYGTASAGEMKLHKLYVHPASQRRGYGTQLLRHVEGITKAYGCSVLCLTVNKANANAINAYRKNGFSLREPVVIDIGGGFVMNDYVMAKEL